MLENLVIRDAEEKDVPVMYRFARELAEYEGIAGEMTATEESYREWIVHKKFARAKIAELDGTPVGWMVYWCNFSTLMGRSGIYLQDLYVQPEYRRKGIGTAMLRYLAKRVVETGCGTLEWACLDWNAPSIRFYKALGARAMRQWTLYRLDGEDLKRLAENGPQGGV